MMANSEELTPEQEAAEIQREKEEQAALPYKWRQTLSEVDINVEIPAGLRGRDLAISIQKQTLSVGVKGKDPIMSGPLHKPIKVEDSTWLLDGTDLQIQLFKINQQEWWDSVIEGHAKINTKRIQPENSKLSDLDGETRGMVEKMV